MKMRLLIPVIFIGVLATLAACKTNHAQTSPKYDSTVTSKVGDQAKSINNQDNRYTLIHSNDTLANDTVYKYIVLRLADNKIVLEGNYNPGGYVKWGGNTMIRVFSIPKHVTSVPDSSMYVRDVFLEQ